MHAYLDGKHERRTRDILAETLPGVSISLSSEVSPEIREYERWSTAAANAYVQPVMDRYLGRLDAALRQRGFACPLFMMTSGGGLAALETARKFPIRLVESGPAGGAILAAALARQCGLDKVLSLRHGRHHRQDLPHRRRRAAAFAHLRGRAPVPLPEGQRPAAAHPGDRDGRDRRRRRLDRLRRFAERASMSGPRAPAPSPARPATAAAAPSPPSPTPTSCWAASIPATSPAARSSSRPTRPAVGRRQGVSAAPLGLEAPRAAFGVSEIVEENMANAARVHAVERGKELQDRTMIAFGGAAPHPCRAAGREARHQPRAWCRAARASARRSAS